MENSNYCQIRTPEDVQIFQDVSNGLHDGYITRVEYNNSGISGHDNCLFFDYKGISLVIHVLATSLVGHPTFEIVFQNIMEWQIRSEGFSDMIGFSILFLENDRLLWADDISSSIAELKRGSYVVAESIQYRQL